MDFYCAELRLILELEGDAHQADASAEYDVARAQYLSACGYRVVRVRNHDVTPDNLKRLIANLVRPPLPVRERGQG